jgi:hypothetical protein
MAEQFVKSLTLVNGRVVSVEKAAPTSSGGGGGAVDSVDGRTGTVTLNDLYAGITHASRHQSGGADPLKLDDLAAPDDNTDLDVSTASHGLTPKAPDDTTKFLRGDGSWAVIPAGGGSGGATEAYARRAPHYPPFSVTGNDDEFDDGSFSGWTAVQDTAPVLTLTESNDCLSVYHPGGDAAAELHAWVKAQSFAANDWIEVALRLTGIAGAHKIVGVIFADGTTYGSGTQVGFYYSANEQRWVRTPHTNYNTTGGVTTIAFQPWQVMSDAFIRLKYLGANNWQAYASPDGVSWIDVFSGSFARTLTPTHGGFFVSTWGGSTPMAASIRYCRFGNG